MRLAMIGYYPFGSIVLAGFCAFAVVAYLVGRRRSAQAAKGDASPRDRVASLGCLVLVCGPLLGLILAFVTCRAGDVNPLDVGYTYGVYVGVGSFVGLLGGVAFAASALIFRPPDAKRTGVVDPDFDRI